MQVIIYTLIRNATLYIKLLTICSKTFDWDLYLKLLDYIVNTLDVFISLSVNLIFMPLYLKSTSFKQNTLAVDCANCSLIIEIFSV